MNFKLSRFLLVLLAPVMSLTPFAAVLAQQPAQADTQTAGAARARPAEDGTVRPIRVSVPEEALVDLRRRLAATRWPERETVDDWYSLADSPVGLAAWCYDKFAEWVFTRGEPERSLTPDEMLDDITLYWLTNTGTSASRIYWENNAKPTAVSVSIPAAVTVFPGEIYQVPRSWAERAYHTLIYYHRVDKGGHFAAWEEPQLFSEEIRAAFRSLR